MPQEVQGVPAKSHDLSMTGRAGAILSVLLATLVTFIAAFSAVGWAADDGIQWGLWQQYHCHRYSEYTLPFPKAHGTAQGPL